MTTDSNVLLIMGIGARSAAERARAKLERSFGNVVELTAFTLGADSLWALRAQPRGCSKGAALSKLASGLGVPRARVAAVGDWYNDIPMLKWAARSFAMGHAPADVRAAATDVLDCTAASGGGIAEALSRWLGVL